jgi:hypothetical protein
LTEAGDGVYKVVRGKAGVVLERSVPAETKQLLKARQEVLMDAAAPLPVRAEALADILMELGIEIAETREEAVRRVTSLFLNYPKEFPGNRPDMIMYKKSGLDGIVRNLISEEPKSGLRANVFETADKTLLYFAKNFRERYDGPIATSFLSGNNKLYYPLNLRSLLNTTTHMVKSGELGERVKGKFGYESGKSGKVTSSLVQLLNFERFRNEFDVVDLDVTKFGNDLNKDTQEYENLTYEQSLAMRMNLYGNENSPLGYFALDTQADRKRLTFITLPKMSNTRSREEYNVLRKNPAAFMRDQILLDLHRMAEAQTTIHSKDESKLIEGYHYKVRKDGTRDYNAGNWKTFNAPGVTMEITTGSKLPAMVRSTSQVKRLTS